MGNTQVFCHRIPAISSLCFASCGFLFAVLGGSGCNFLDVHDSSAAHGTFISDVHTDDLIPHILLPPSIGIGPICTSPYYSHQKSGMWNASQTFFISSLITGAIVCITFFAITFIIAPSDRSWKFASVMSAISAVLQVPIFLLLESRPCTMDENHSCKLSSGALLLICSIISYVFATITTQCTDTPLWAVEMNAWRVKDMDREDKENYLNDYYDEDDEEAGYFPSSYDREAAIIANRRKLMLTSINNSKHRSSGRNGNHPGVGLWRGWKRWWSQYWYMDTLQTSSTESDGEWEYDGGGEHIGTASMPLGVTVAKTGVNCNILSTNKNARHRLGSPAAISKEKCRSSEVHPQGEMEETQLLYQNTIAISPIKPSSILIAWQENVSALIDYDTDDSDSRLLLHVDPVTGRRITKNQSSVQGYQNRKESESMTLDDFTNLGLNLLGTPCYSGWKKFDERISYLYTKSSRTVHLLHRFQYRPDIPGSSTGSGILGYEYSGLSWPSCLD